MRAGPLLACVAAFALAGAAQSQPARTPPGPDMRVILAPQPAETLAAYRLFEDAGADHPAAGVAAYDIAPALFTDYAAKQRYVFLPPGTKANVAADGAYEFPVGAVLIKTFAYPGAEERKIETRLLIRQARGWTANTYVWSADGREAHLQVAGAQLNLDFTLPDGRTTRVAYAIPNRNQCKGCHSLDGDVAPIGPSATHFAQPASGEEAESARWHRLGLLADAPSIAPPTDPARAYLDINCAHCHNPRGPANTSGLDLRATQANPAQWGLRKRPVAAGRGAADMQFAIDPGNPDRSILLYRMQSADPGVMMPELGRSLVHDEGVAQVRAWIASMDSEGRPRTTTTQRK